MGHGRTASEEAGSKEKGLLDAIRRRIRPRPGRAQGALVIAVAALTLLATGAPARGARQAYPLEDQRFGVGLAGPADEILDYDLESLGATWYLNWGAASDPPHPNGATFVQTVRLDEGTSALTGTQLATYVAANPGSVWQIGNEPDSPWMDNTTPQDYAAAYHDLYQIIKDADPTAQVAFGGLVQATPLRMRYLEQVWQAYEDAHGAQMPVDVWTVHGFILREAETGWGAGIPPGLEDHADLGMEYQIRDHDRLDIFAAQIERFRQWMADNGQREKPLLVPEYGILMWSDILDEDGEDFSDERVIAFMHGTFDYFLSAEDDAIGYPEDGNRLVQSWAWYSLDDNVYEDGQLVGYGYNGDLATGPGVKRMTPLGLAYGEYVVGDLAPDSLHLIPPVPLLDHRGAVSATAKAVVRRAGGLEATPDTEVWFWIGEAGQGQPAARCALGSLAPGQEVTVTSTLAFTAAGPYTVTAQVDPGDAVIEVREGNNSSGEVVLVASGRVYLPTMLRSAVP